MSFFGSGEVFQSSLTALLYKVISAKKWTNQPVVTNALLLLHCNFSFVELKFSVTCKSQEMVGLKNHALMQLTYVQWFPFATRRVQNQTFFFIVNTAHEETDT